MNLLKYLSMVNQRVLFVSVMSFLVIPPLIYHNIFQEVYAKIEPYIIKFEKTFNIKRKRRARKGRYKKLYDIMILLIAT